MKILLSIVLMLNIGCVTKKDRLEYVEFNPSLAIEKESSQSQIYSQNGNPVRFSDVRDHLKLLPETSP